MRVAVALSGGVDSSTAVDLLKRQGHEVIAVTMRLGEASAVTLERARKSAEILQVEHHVLDAAKRFREEVIAPFCRSYAEGRTPNPCVECNALLKWGALREAALFLGCERFATGHYVRIEQESEGPLLRRGVDPVKDQSYFLYRLTRDQLRQTLFPLGELTKDQVRAAAERIGLAIPPEEESQEICFVSDGRHASLVEEILPGSLRPGEIVDGGGRVVGRHKGLAHYTIGQRRGLDVALGERVYVTAIDPENNRIVVGAAEEGMVSLLRAGRAVWNKGVPDGAEVAVQIRYRSQPVKAVLSHYPGGFSLAFKEKLSGVAPGQSAVCYEGGLVLGGGIITEAVR